MGVATHGQINFLFSVCTADVNIVPNVTVCEDPTSAANLYELCRFRHLCLPLSLTNFIALAVSVMPVEIFNSDSDKMTWLWYQSSKQGWVSSGNMGGRTGQALLKRFSITEEREAIVL